MAILLVPGFMADETLWDDMVPALARFGPVVHADLRHDTSVETMARRVLETAPPVFQLVGFSMGGYVARAIARQAPDRARALVLVSTSTRGDTAALQKRKGAIGNAAPSIAFSGLSRTAVARDDSTMTTANANLSWLRTLMVAKGFMGLLVFSGQQESMKIAMEPVCLEATQDSAG
jgi:pimeloyl-ACP methyl ester carboxylesterase